MGLPSSHTHTWHANSIDKAPVYVVLAACRPASLPVNRTRARAWMDDSYETLTHFTRPFPCAGSKAKNVAKTLKKGVSKRKTRVHTKVCRWVDFIGEDTDGRPVSLYLATCRDCRGRIGHLQTSPAHTHAHTRMYPQSPISTTQQVHFYRPKTVKLARNPKYARKSVPHMTKMDKYRLIRYPLTTGASFFLDYGYGGLMDLAAACGPVGSCLAGARRLRLFLSFDCFYRPRWIQAHDIGRPVFPFFSFLVLRRDREAATGDTRLGKHVPSNSIPFVLITFVPPPTHATNLYIAESAMKKIEDNNTLVFIVDIQVRPSTL